MAYQELFNLLYEQHDITPIESEMNDIINVCREIISKENKESEPIYKVGDKVYHYAFGSGIIESIDMNSDIKYPIKFTPKRRYPIFVRFENDCVLFTIDGICSSCNKKPSLSFTEYDLVNGGFSQKRPKI